MSNLTRSDAIASALAAILMLIAGRLGLTEYAGAHPFWSSGVVYIGAPLGVAFAIIIKILGVSRRTQLFLSAALLALAVWAAQSGKAGFVASYAEDALAGQMWYVGWIATAAFATAFLTRLISRP